jgi:hypothetical protein
MENDIDLMAFSTWRGDEPEVERSAVVLALIFAGRDRPAQLGFGLEAAGGPMPDFFGLTVKGVVLDDEETQQLPLGFGRFR